MTDDEYLKLKRNQIKMVRARGYDISDEEWILDEELTGKKFKKTLLKKYEKSYPMRRLLFSEYKKPNDKTLFVFYVGLDKNCKQIKIESIQPFIKKLTEEKVKKDGLLIVNAELSGSATLTLSTITESNYQIMQEHLFQFDLLSHLKVPQHIALSEKEVEEFKNRNGVNNKLMPNLPKNDVVAMYYNFKSGQMIKIITFTQIDFLLSTNVSHCIVN